MTAPEKAGPIAWTVEAVSKKGKARDRLVFEQTVEPAVPVETWAASLFRVGPNTTLPIAIPAGALPGGYGDIAPTGPPPPPLHRGDLEGGVAGRGVFGRGGLGGRPHI